MVNWPIPKTVRQLRGFVGLTGYYRKFIQNYDIISRYLYELLKKDIFHWSVQAQTTFNDLKSTLFQALVLNLSDFSKPFVIETDASQ
jgi:RNase H-like domain found in reverse transcriptase